MEITRTKKAKVDRWVLILAALIGIGTINLLASHHFGRLDLTKTKLYTLAPATRKILKNLDDVVTIRLYFTPDLPPALTNVRRDVEDMLAEYKTYAGKHIKVEYYNPQANPITEQKVQMMGIPPIELNVIEKDKQEVAKIYLGMTVDFASRQEVLAVVQNTNNLEYRLDAAIVKVAEVKKPVLGWWGTQSPKEAPNGYEEMIDRLKQRYEVRIYDAAETPKLVVDEIPTLVFVVPEKLSDAQKKVFTDYLDKGGKAILLSESFSVGSQGLKPIKKENPVDDILKTYGVKVGKELVADRANAMATFTGGVVSYHMAYPFWVKIIPEDFDPTQPMVSELTAIVLPWPSPIHVSQPLPEGVSATTLFKTTKYGTITTVNPALPLDPQTTQKMIQEGKQETSPLGVMLVKKNKEATETQLVAVGDAAFVQNQYLQLFEENAVFLENAVDVLSAGSQLLGVRTKGNATAPIAILSSGQKTAIRFIDIFISPLLLLGMGVGIYFWKRTRVKRLRALYSL